MKTENLKKFEKLVSNENSGWLEKALWREKNEVWLDNSAKIAVRILREIRVQKPVNGMSQKMLAEQMGVSAQYINKVVKGQENLTLETIAKIEDVLGIKLIEVQSYSAMQFFVVQPSSINGKVDKNRSKTIGSGETKVITFADYFIEQEPEYTPNGTYGY